MSLDRFWFRSDDVAIPYLASAAVKEGILFDNDDFIVYLCGVRKGPEAVEGGASGLTIPNGEHPTSNHPCGVKGASQDADATPHLLATVTHNNVEVSPDGATLDPTGTLDPGIWGLWTVAAKPVSFLDPGCNAFFPFFSSCPLESNPPSPEVVIGIDDAPPRFDVAALGTTTNIDDAAVVSTPTVALKLSSIVDDLPRADGPGSVALSGVEGYSCFVDDGTTLAAKSCSLNDDVINVTLPGNPVPELSYDIYVVATDLAGNTSAPLDGGGLPDKARFDDDDADEFDDNRVTVIYDKTPPAQGTASISSPASATGANGWYLSPPTEYKIDGFNDGANGSGQAKAGGFQYRFDGADWASCTAPCTLADPIPLPGPGTHTLSWKAIDGAVLESAGRVDPDPRRRRRAEDRGRRDPRVRRGRVDHGRPPVGRRSRRGCLRRQRHRAAEHQRPAVRQQPGHWARPVRHLHLGPRHRRALRALHRAGGARLRDRPGRVRLLRRRGRQPGDTEHRGRLDELHRTARHRQRPADRQRHRGAARPDRQPPVVRRRRPRPDRDVQRLQRHWLTGDAGWRVPLSGRQLHRVHLRQRLRGEPCPARSRRQRRALDRRRHRRQPGAGAADRPQGRHGRPALVLARREAQERRRQRLAHHEAVGHDRRLRRAQGHPRPAAHRVRRQEAHLHAQRWRPADLHRAVRHQPRRLQRLPPRRRHRRQRRGQQRAALPAHRLRPEGPDDRRAREPARHAQPRRSRTAGTRRQP